MTQPITPENAIGRVSRMDAINNKSVNEAALRKAQQKLQKLEIALQSIDSTSFGTCSRCGNPILEGRLMFMPESTNCVRCASAG
jgi:DnaK suppressor protein